MADMGVDTSFYPQANPNALLGTAGDVVSLANAGAQNRLINTDAQIQHLNLVKGQVDYLANGMSALAAKPDLSADDMIGFGQRAVQEGILDPQVFQTEMTQVQAAGNDPAKLRALAQNYQLRAMDAGQRFAAQYGMTPGAQSDIVTYTSPTGQSVTTTRGNLVAKIGAGNPMQSANPLLTGQGGGQGANPLTSGSVGTPAPAQPATPTQPAGLAAPSPQQQAQFDASAKQQQDDLTADSSYASNVVPLTKTISLLPSTTIGLGSELPNNIARVFSTFGVPIGNDQAKNASEVEKYLTQLVRSSGASANSDNQLAAAFSANPNMTTDKAAATDVLKTMLSLTRMQHAKVQQAQSQGIAPENYSKWASQWGSSIDPRAFGVDLMTPAAKQALRAQLDQDPAAAKRFVNSYVIAQQNGAFDQGPAPAAQ